MRSDLSFEDFEHWRDRYGWIIGVIVIISAITAIIVRYRFSRPLQTFHFVGLAMGLGIGSLFFIPAVPRLVTALRLLVIARAPVDTSGPFPVATADISLPSVAADDPAIFVQIWYPSARTPPSAAKRSEFMEPPLCSGVLEQAHLPGAKQQFPLLLYAPGNSGVSNDSASTTAELASHGYIVMAIDDIERDRHWPAAGETLQRLTFNFSSAEAFSNTLRTGDHKARLQAARALTALDRFEACANAEWRTRVRFDRVGFFGFSFGGATAAEASTFDPRVVAVANLDGALMGRAAFGALEKPYLIILTKDEIFPKPSQLQSSDPNERYLATFAERDLREEVRLANRPGSFGIRIRNAYHENLSDLIFSRSFFRTWLAVNPYRVKTIRDAYLLAFFDTYLRGMPSALLTRAPSPFHEVEILKANQSWLKELAENPAAAAGKPN